MAKAATLRTLSDDQLLDELESARQELFNLRFAFATGQLDNSAQMSATRRDIARIHTVLREREIAAAEVLAGAPQGSAVPAGASQASAVPAGASLSSAESPAADDMASTGDPS